MSALSIWSVAWSLVSVFVIVAGLLTILFGPDVPTFGLVLIGVAVVSMVMQTYIAAQRENIKAMRGQRQDS